MEKMGKKTMERRVYTKEFKLEAVALAEKGEKPISHIAKDLGLNENVLYRWVAQARGAANGIQVFPGRGKPRDEELIRLRREVKSLRSANEILKKAAVIADFSPTHKENPSNGIPIHEIKPEAVHH
jgi:transposase